MNDAPTLTSTARARFSPRSLFALAPRREDHWVALRTGLGIALPLLVLLALHRVDLAPYAVFGAFTGIYSRVTGHLDRLLMQLKASALMWGVILLAWCSGAFVVRGATSTTGLWLLVACTSLVAGACTVLAFLLRLRPTGPLFHIFAFAALSSLPAQPRIGDAMFTVSATMVLGLLLGQTGRLSPVRRTPWTVSPGPGAPPRFVAAAWREGAAHLVAASLAGAIAAALSGPLGMGHTYWAMVAAVVPLVGHTVTHRVVRGVHRVLGTAAGLVPMIAIVALHPSPWVAVMIIGAVQFLTEMFVVRNYFWGQFFVTPLALVGISLGAPLTGGILYDRGLETLIGAVVGIAVVLVLARISPLPPRRVHVMG